MKVALELVRIFADYRGILASETELTAAQVVAELGGRPLALLHTELSIRGHLRNDTRLAVPIRDTFDVGHDVTQGVRIMARKTKSKSDEMGTF